MDEAMTFMLDEAYDILLAATPFDGITRTLPLQEVCSIQPSKYDEHAIEASALDE
jgi:hypothetical protein